MSTRPGRVPNVNDLERLLRTKSVRVVAADDEAAQEVLAEIDRKTTEQATRDDRRRKQEPI